MKMIHKALSGSRTHGLAAVLLALAVLASRPAAAGAEPPTLTPDSPIEDYLALAAENHPAIKAGEERWTARREAVAEARGWPDPVLSYGYYLESVETAVGPQQHRIGLNQSVPWFGKLASRGKAAEEMANAAEQDWRAERLRVYESVGQAYYEYAWLAEAIRVTQENLQLLTDQEVVARARYRTQSGSYSELIKAQVEQGVLQDHLNTLEDRRGALSARLNETLGRLADAPLPWPVNLVPPAWEPPEEQALHDLLPEQNPRLLSLDRQILAKESTVRAARLDGLPDFNVGVQTILTGESELTNFPGQGKDAWVLSLGVALPLWRGQYRGAENAARATQRMLEYRHREAQLDLLARSDELLFGLRDAERKIDLYGNTLLPKARQALETTSSAFQNGNASFLDYVDAERTLLMFQLEYARAQADYGQQVLKVARLAGTALIESGESDREESVR